ncbi:MAG: hypothetical protein KatS3mg090_0913 [Patescibacteria group bacterium]|nr:MAG: hypothetical protein KatS3mg090_0913 [Patescibacteria group bacterium]
MIIGKDIQGFSLIELLVVIAMIGFLVAVGVANYNQARKRARDSQRINDLKALQSALELYKQGMSTPAYPANFATITPCAKWTSNGQTLMNSFPADPMGDGCTYKYYYSRPTTLEYNLSACMEANTQGPNITSTPPSGFTPPDGADCKAYYVLTQP